ncbi:sulfite exporter TauE/SafE family protein [bacterium]|nr:sulfite exporter TauE/SafE family protein [bacterium]
MVSDLWLGIVSALWLGILTSISPCPLATNIAAISFISKRTGKVTHTLLSGILYTLGRVLSYGLVAFIIAASALSVSSISNFLQYYVNLFLGPILILVGMILTRLLRLKIKGIQNTAKIQVWAEKAGILGAVLLGMIFALAFCPISAALFFGTLIPLSLKYQSSLILPASYGIGTAIPVIGFTILLAISSRLMARMFNKINSFERGAQFATGIIFILIGIYLSLKYIYHLL